MSLSGFATLTTIITYIITYITVPIITVFFTEYVRRRISSTRSQEIFLYALKDYDKEFLNDYNVVKHYIKNSLIGLSIGGIIAVVLLAIKYSYALNSLLQYITIFVTFITFLRIVVAVFILSIKNSRQVYIAKAAALGIFNDPTASLIVSTFAFILLLTLQLWHTNFIQNNLEILFTYLIYWLFYAYFPTAYVWWRSKDISSNITTSWEFRLINLRISDLKTSFWLGVKLNYGHYVYGRLLQVNNFGIILEEYFSKGSSVTEPFRTYVPWQEVVSIGIVKNVEI
jgi:hypothetical protein